MNNLTSDIELVTLEQVHLMSDILSLTEFNKAVGSIDTRLSDITINENADLDECRHVLKRIITRFGGNN